MLLKNGISSENLKERQPIDFSTYEKLHRKQAENSVVDDKKGFGLDYTETENPVLKGARYYKYKIS